MFGSPLTLSIVMFCLFGLGGGTALYRVMGAEGKKAVKNTPVASTEVVKTSSWVTLRSAHPLASLSVTIDGQEVLLDHVSEYEYEAECDLPASFTLSVNARWPSDTPETALLILVEPDGSVSQERTLWGSYNVKEELVFDLLGNE